MRKLSYSILFVPLMASAQPAADPLSKDSAASEQGVAPGGASLSQTAPSDNSARADDRPAQNSLSTTPSFYGTTAPAGNPSIGLPGFAAVPSKGLERETSTPLKWGPFTAHPHFGYAFTYASGVLTTPGASSDTAVHTVSPGLTILSRHLTLDYTPSLSYYSKGPYEDSVNHSVNFAASFGYDDWSFQIAQGYQNSSQPLIETGTQTDQESFATSLGASWRFNERIFFDFSVTQFIQNSQGFQNSKQWSTMEWVNYRLTPSLSIGAGVGGGYSAVEFGSSSAFEHIQGRLNWNPSRKLSVNLNGGIEIRQFVDYPDSDSLINPLMGVSVGYRPFETTSLHLAANRSVDTSLFANDINETTSVSAGVSQRLLGRFNLGVTTGFRTTDYRNIATFVAQNQFLNVDRSDDSTFVAVSIGTSFLKKGSISFGYQHSKNESSLNGFTYDSDQFSVQIGYRF